MAIIRSCIFSSVRFVFRPIRALGPSGPSKIVSRLDRPLSDCRVDRRGQGSRKSTPNSPLTELATK